MMTLQPSPGNHCNHSFEAPQASLISTSSADHLCEEPEGGGRVRFVNSTVRYHMGGGSAQTLWTGRTRLEQVLMVAVACLIFLSSILLIVIGKTQEGRPGTNETGPDLCLSQECVKVAATILSDIDTSVEPCNDFYKVIIRYIIPKQIHIF